MDRILKMLNVNCTENSTTINPESSATVIHIPSLVSMVVFYFAILIIGVFASWRNKSLSQKSSENVMLAGRDIGFFVGTFTLTATVVGGGYLNGSAQAVYESGLLWCQAPMGYTISVFIIGLFFAKPMRRAGYVTMLDPFQIKLGRVMTALLYIPAIMGDLFWTAAILSALGYTLYVITGLSHLWSVIISASIAVLYTLVGGLWSVAITDIIQLVCVFAGLWLVVPFALTHSAVTSISETFYSNDSWGGSISDNEIGIYIDLGLLLILGGLPWQVYYQRILAMRTPERAQTLSFLAAFGCFLLAIPSVILGAVCKSTAWNETEYGIDPDPMMALPMVMRYLTPTAVAVIGLGAVSAAVMSSTDSAILSSSTMFARNVYTPIRDALLSLGHYERATDREVLIVMRIAVLIIGVLATVLAVVIQSVYGLFVLCADLMYVIMFPQLVCIVYVPFINTYGSLIGYIVGMILRLASGEAMLSLPPLIKYPYYDDEDGQRFPFRTLAMLISLVLMLLISYLTQSLFIHNILPSKADIFKCMEPSREMEGVKPVVDIERKTDRLECENGKEKPLDIMGQETVTTQL